MQLTDYTGTFSDGLFPYLWWIIPLAAAAYLSKSMLLKHFFERFAVNTQAQCRLDAEHYHEFRNLDIRSNGRHEQIDYVYVSRFGIFVVAAPGCQGRISGDSGGAFWREEYHKHKTDFPNPLLKNQMYIQALAKQLELSPSMFYSVVAVTGNCQFQSVMPDNVLDVADFADYIAQSGEEVLDDLEVARIKSALEVNEFDVVFSRTGFDKQAWES